MNFIAKKVSLIFLFLTVLTANGFYIENFSSSATSVKLQYNFRCKLTTGTITSPAGFKFAIGDLETDTIESDGSINTVTISAEVPVNIGKHAFSIPRIAELCEGESKLYYQCLKSLRLNGFEFTTDDLFYRESLEFGHFKLGLNQGLQKVRNKASECFGFALENIDPDPVLEKEKDPRLKCPAPVIRSLYGKDSDKALIGIEYIATKTAQGLNFESPEKVEEPNKIPLTSHRVWLTDFEQPKEPSLKHLQIYVESVANLNLSSGWRHKFWCWRKDMIPNTCKMLEECGQNIEIIELSNPSEWSKIQGQHIILAAIDHGLYTLAGNIIRNNILFNEGGIYTDLGTEIKHDLKRLMRKNSFIAHLRRGRTDTKAWWIDHDFMAATPHNPINKEFLRMASNLYQFRDRRDITEFFNNPRMMHCLTNAKLLTEVTWIKAQENNLDILILPDEGDFNSCKPTRDSGGFLEVHHASSWYGKGPDKSCRNIDDTTLDWFSVSPDYVNTRDQLIKDGFDLEKYKRFIAPCVVTPGEAIHHFLEKSKGLSQALVAELPVIVTLTTWKAKIHNAYLAIRSLLDQTVPPNKIVLWLATEEFADRKIPTTLSSLVDRGLLDVRWHHRNIRSAKKLIPSLQDPTLKDSLLVTADDDIVYKPDWLEGMLRTHKTNPNAIIAQRARKVIFERTGKLMPYNRWRLHTGESPLSEQDILFPTSGGGILFPPFSLASGATNEDLFMQKCPTGDDILWWIHALEKGTKIISTEKPQTSITDLNGEEEQEASLWTLNQHGANDQMLRAMLDLYKGKRDLDPRLLKLLRGIAHEAIAD